MTKTQIVVEPQVAHTIDLLRADVSEVRRNWKWVAGIDEKQRGIAFANVGEILDRWTALCSEGSTANLTVGKQRKVRLTVKNKKAELGFAGQQMVVGADNIDGEKVAFKFQQALLNLDAHLQVCSYFQHEPEPDFKPQLWDLWNSVMRFLIQLCDENRGCQLEVYRLIVSPECGLLTRQFDPTLQLPELLTAVYRDNVDLCSAITEQQLIKIVAHLREIRSENESKDKYSRGVAWLKLLEVLCAPCGELHSDNASTVMTHVLDDNVLTKVDNDVERYIEMIQGNEDSPELEYCSSSYAVLASLCEGVISDQNELRVTVVAPYETVMNTLLALPSLQATLKIPDALEPPSIVAQDTGNDNIAQVLLTLRDCLTLLSTCIRQSKRSSCGMI